MHQPKFFAGQKLEGLEPFEKYRVRVLGFSDGKYRVVFSQLKNGRSSAGAIIRMSPAILETFYRACEPEAA